jgi:hypothetical protein
LKMPLQNRVDPFGTLVATEMRGSLMGNRGGAFHYPQKQSLGNRHWVSRQWISCKLSFNNRKRIIWGTGYTELFFCDEVTALAAGHRPCFECRRSDATAFAAAWGRAEATPPPCAGVMDRALDSERLEPDPARQGKRRKRLHSLACSGLPDGAMISLQNAAHMISGDSIRRWSFAGYGDALPRPRGHVMVITPPSILACLASGYQPGL